MPTVATDVSWDPRKCTHRQLPTDPLRQAQPSFQGPGVLGGKGEGRRERVVLGKEVLPHKSVGKTGSA